MDTDLFWDISINDQSAISVELPRQTRWEGLQQKIEELLGPLVDRRTIKDRRQGKRANPGRRFTD